MPRFQTSTSTSTSKSPTPLGVKTPSPTPFFQSPLGPIMPRHQTFTPSGGVQTPIPNGGINTPLTQTIQVQNKTSVWESVKGGFGFGVGNSIAQRIIGPTPSAPAPSPPPAPINPCEKEDQEYSTCLSASYFARDCLDKSNAYKSCLSRQEVPK